MDQALTAVNGSFVLAAKLLDIRPGTFRSKVFYHPKLRLKWGHKAIGRPPNCPKLQVQAFKDTPAHRATYRGVGFVMEIVSCLSKKPQIELQRWLETKLSSEGENLTGRVSNTCGDHEGACPADRKA